MEVVTFSGICCGFQMSAFIVIKLQMSCINWCNICTLFFLVRQQCARKRKYGQCYALYRPCALKDLLFNMNFDFCSYWLPFSYFSIWQHNSASVSAHLALATVSGTVAVVCLQWSKPTVEVVSRTFIDWHGVWLTVVIIWLQLGHFLGYFCDL